MPCWKLSTRLLRNFLNIDPFLTRPAPIESLQWELSIGTGLVKNGSVLRKSWDHLCDGIFGKFIRFVHVRWGHRTILCSYDVRWGHRTDRTNRTFTIRRIVRSHLWFLSFATSSPFDRINDTVINPMPLCCPPFSSRSEVFAVGPPIVTQSRHQYKNCSSNLQVPPFKVARKMHRDHHNVRLSKALNLIVPELS